jgi:hypothetical protein
MIALYARVSTDPQVETGLVDFTTATERRAA